MLKYNCVKIKHLVLTVISIAILSACTKNELIQSKDTNEQTTLNLTTEEIDRIPLLSRNHSIDDSKIKEEAQKIIDLLNATEVTLKSSSTARSIDHQKVITVKGSKLRSSSDSISNIDIHVFNFGDDAGYAILSGDDRLPAVLCYSGAGDIKDTIDNPGLQVFLSRIPEFVEKSIEQLEEKKDSIYERLEQKIESSGDVSLRSSFLNISFQYGDWETVSTVAPLISVNWGQRYPFNTSLNRIDGSLPPAGCVATAVAQILSFHKRPTKYDWNSFVKMPYSWNWYSASESQIKSIGELFKTLGMPSNLDMSYSLEGSGAYSSNVPRTFSNFGYTTGSLQDYNYSAASLSIGRGRPVYISGSAIETKKTSGWWIFTTTTTSYSEGHAWVIDGLRSVKRPRTVLLNGKVIGQSTEYSDMVHCNFGWNGSSNGYYFSGVFDTNNTPVLKSGTSGYYQYKLQIIPDIKPN